MSIRQRIASVVGGRDTVPMRSQAIYRVTLGNTGMRELAGCSRMEDGRMYAVVGDPRHIVRTYRLSQVDA